MKKRTRRIITWGAIVIGVLLMAAYVVPCFFQWSELHCRYQDVDINTGRLRFQRYVLFRKFSERIEESALSEVLPASLLADTEPEWHRVNTFSPGVYHSPHYIFHSAISQIRNLEKIWEMAELLPDIKQKTALHVLALWHYYGEDFGASYYIIPLYGMLDENKRGALIERIRQLEMPKEEREDGVITRTVFYPDGRPMDRARGYLDATGQFVRHGVRETWHPDGSHYEDAYQHGRRSERER